MRLTDHPILDFKRGKIVHIFFDGKVIEAYEGETISAALHANGIVKLSDSHNHKRARGLFCAIGHCSSCLMTVEGIPNIRICVTKVKDGMKVETQKPRGGIND